MHINKLTEDYAVCAQIQAADVAAIKAAGYRSIICNRPDGEELGQPPVTEIAAAAKAEG
ncbi:MAG: beta-lactamase hydrolase domain-containing protein, partial [Steroidobacteraceae bacterium]